MTQQARLSQAQQQQQQLLKLRRHLWDISCTCNDPKTDDYFEVLLDVEDEVDKAIRMVGELLGEPRGAWLHEQAPGCYDEAGDRKPFTR